MKDNEYLEEKISKDILDNKLYCDASVVMKLTEENMRWRMYYHYIFILIHKRKDDRPIMLMKDAPEYIKDMDIYDRLMELIQDSENYKKLLSIIENNK